MHILSRSLALALPLFLPAPAFPAAAGGDAWVEEFDKASAAAKEKGKDLLVDFTGSDWCGWCIRLDSEVFSHAEFLDAVRDDFVLVKLDFPRKKENLAKVPDIDRNRELQRKYGVNGFPSILLMTHDGEVYARTGYQAGGPKNYVDHLDGLRKTRRAQLLRALELSKEFYAASGEAKDAALAKVLDTLGTMSADSPGVDKLAGPARYALTVDADNARGLKERALEALFGVDRGDQELDLAAAQVDPQNARGLREQAILAWYKNLTANDLEVALSRFDQVATHGLRDGKLALLLYYSSASMTHQYLQDTPRAQAYARKALALEPTDPKVREDLAAILES